MKCPLALLITLLIFAQPAWACPPCAEGITPLEEIVAQSDLIVIGRRHNPPWFFDDNNSNDGPGFIGVEVERVLKGQLTKKIITTSSWSGMCSYGVILFKERALLLLREVSSGHYETVDPVCGIHQYTIIDDHLTQKDHRGMEIVNVPLMSVNEFIEQFIEAESDE